MNGLATVGYRDADRGPVMMRLGGLACALALVAYPAPSGAQDHQLSGFAGWRFGGSGQSPISRRQIDIAGATSFGVSASLWIWGPSWVELHLSRADSVARPTLFANDERDVELTYLHLGYVHELRSGRVRPFLGGSLGAARMREGGDEPRNLFSAGAVVGLRVFPSRHLGLRADGRLLLVVGDERRGRSRSSLGSRGITFGGPVIIQAELSVGLVVAF